MWDALVETARGAKREELRGLAVAALWDAASRDRARRDRARELADEMVTSRCIGNVAWSALVRASANRPEPRIGTLPVSAMTAPPDVVLGETPFRWVQLAWLE
jgi:hypothetical protein